MSKCGVQSNNTQLLAICGIIGPALYTLVMIIIGLLRPGYNPITQHMSELGEVGGSNAMIMNIAGFIMFGLLMIAFASGFHRGISEGKGSKIGPASIAIAGTGAVLIGVFPYDPSAIFPSFAGIMHGVSVLILSVGLVLAPFTIARRIKHDQRWKGYRLYSLATGVVTAFVGVVFLSMSIRNWSGLLQRVAMEVPLLWVEAMAIKLLRICIRPRTRAD